LENLIAYLEKLTENPDKQLNDVADYNKDYTALLLNCYVKKEKFDKIRAYIQTATAEQTKHLRIFDVDTAIDVCREHRPTRDQAISLATQQQKWNLLVQIYIDDEEEYTKAQEIIEREIRNIRDRVDILKVYGPKILKHSTAQHERRQLHSTMGPSLSEKLMHLVQRIAEDATSNDSAKSYAPGQIPVKIEELLQIFVDHPDHLRTFLEYVVLTLGERGVDFNQRRLTDINLHHRLLECYLYKNQSLETARQDNQDSSKVFEESNAIKQSISSFLRKNDVNGKIDKNYVLFLFQIYQYNEGVKDCCKSLNLRQELLTFYIHHNETNEVFEWCRNPGISSRQQNQASDGRERMQ
jgi:hypothetical protein